MKKLGILTFMLLSGCASTNLNTLPISSAKISELSVNEIKNNENKIHNIDITFNYVINQFNDNKNLYHCSVQFLALDGTTLSTYYGDDIPCKIDKPSGEVSITWKTPFNKSLHYNKSLLFKLKQPIQYFVALHQMTNNSSSQIIGNTKIQTLKTNETN